MKQMILIYTCKVLARKPARKRPLGRPKSRWGIILKFIINILDWSVWTRYEYRWAVAIHANEASGLVRSRAFLC
jgi:hypothetical protein